MLFRIDLSVQAAPRGDPMAALRYERTSIPSRFGTTPAGLQTQAGP
ncbi:MAG: hypothetical protein ACYDCE_08485 [Candidatus Acidiferrales bacterium]